MRFSWILSFYIGRQLAIWLFGTFAALTATVFLLDFIELLRRGTDKEGAYFLVLLYMALLKLPSMACQIMPFAILFGSMLAFSQLTRSNELVVARSVGFSVWQFMMPPIFIALAMGIINITVLNSISSVMLKRFQQLEDYILRNRSDEFLSMQSREFWMREQNEKHHIVIHARNMHYKNNGLFDVVILIFDCENHFQKRIDANKATLFEGKWVLKDVVITVDQSRPRPIDEISFPTNLTMDNFQHLYLTPKTMSLWELQRFIKLLENTGFLAIKYRLYWHAKLASPLLMIDMIMIAAIFSLRLTRNNNILTWAAGGLCSGFLIYFLSDIIFALGMATKIPAYLAAWTPAITTMLVGIAGNLHLEDG
ncbi:putative permease [Candidatus Endolissoclinum faulkneri L5]|uniref:Putative permease n=1 Tax=Candidatus Endolissoclinum faulkneri L5 TaxID=1401328 RepID=V9TT30_9PROT|nr:LPS export ABC transporter permease LptG [Candidatus Endolissoclinum faulkneri]AHC73731.1 putative permease [Candidatus Endolissoclinum faulkneri L5]